MYKGYRVDEEVIHDYQYPETAYVIQAPCGCAACCDEVQPGHLYCSTSPDELADAEHAFRRLETGRGWFWQYTGPIENVDTFLESEEEHDRRFWRRDENGEWEAY